MAALVEDQAPSANLDNYGGVLALGKQALFNSGFKSLFYSLYNLILSLFNNYAHLSNSFRIMLNYREFNGHLVFGGKARVKVKGVVKSQDAAVFCDG